MTDATEPEVPDIDRLAERAGIETDQRIEMCNDVLAEIRSRELHSVRLAFVDAHGLLRGKTLRADLISSAFANGIGITGALLLKDTGQHNVYPVWAPGGGLDKPWLTGAGDIIMLPDPTTFKVLPWLDGTGWLLCDIFSPNGEPVGFSTRRVCAEAEQAMIAEGYGFTAGLEIEFHLYQMAPDATAATRVSPGGLADTHPGWVYLSENRFDVVEPFLGVLRKELAALDLAPRSLEIELGPSQVELTFSPGSGTQVADQAVLVRSAIKQIARRNGLLATFMSRPNLPGSFSSGWHLHQSVTDLATGVNLFIDDGLVDVVNEERPPSALEGSNLSQAGEFYLAGLLAHATESCVLTTPTVNGYKRYQPDSLAPLRVAWGTQHRGAMLRVIGHSGDSATRIENRVGDSAANPYLYVASQMLAGLAGLEAKEPPPLPTTAPYDETAGPRLPRTLGEAIDSFETSVLYRATLGTEFVEYLVGLKRAEWDRYLGAVTDWEQNEYLELF